MEANWKIESNMSRVKEGAWVFGEFEGHFTKKNQQLRLEKGIIKQAKSTNVAVVNQADDLIQQTLDSVWVEFADEKRTFDVALAEITLRNYTLDVIKVEGEMIYGHIKGLVWAKYQDVGRNQGKGILFWLFNSLFPADYKGGQGGRGRGSSLWPYLLIMLLLLIPLISPQTVIKDSDDQWRRIVSPTLPKQDDQIVPRVEQLDDTQEQVTPTLANDEGTKSIGMCDTQLRLDASLLFERNKSIFKENAIQELNKLKPLLELLNEQALVLRVIGHTDSTGSDLFNQKLSVERAQAVANWLNQSANIPLERIRIVGKGESELLTTDLREQYLNRRVEIGFVCTDEGVPFIYTNTDSETTPIPFDENEDNVLVYVPNGIRVEDAVKTPSVFLNSCGRPLLLSSDLLFQFDRATLQSQAIEQLKEIAVVLNSSVDSSLKLKIVGHSDANGSEEHNQRLSYRRAQRVADWLIKNNVLERNQIVTEGQGEKNLIVPATASVFGQRFNRRVEMIIVCSAQNVSLDS